MTKCGCCGHECHKSIPEEVPDRMSIHSKVHQDHLRVDHSLGEPKYPRTWNQYGKQDNL